MNITFRNTSGKYTFVHFQIISIHFESRKKCTNKILYASKNKNYSKVMWCWFLVNKGGLEKGAHLDPQLGIWHDFDTFWAHPNRPTSPFQLRLVTKTRLRYALMQHPETQIPLSQPHPTSPKHHSPNANPNVTMQKTADLTKRCACQWNTPPHFNILRFHTTPRYFTRIWHVTLPMQNPLQKLPTMAAP